MRKLRVTASMKRELADLRDSKGNVRRGGVMHAPKMLSFDEWEALASVQQDKLIAASEEDRAERDPKPVVVGRDVEDVTHHYRVSR